MEKFLSDKYKLILEEFESGYDKENHIFVPPQQTTNSSSQTETDYLNIFDEITMGDLSWLPQPDDVDDLFTRLVNGE